MHLLAPLLLVLAVFLGFAVLPMGRNMVRSIWMRECSSSSRSGRSTELSVFMAGWSSRNKYSLLGAMRAIAQMISYEVPLILSAVSVIMITGTLSAVSIVESAVGIFRHRAALVCPDALGIRRVRSVHDRCDGGIESLAIRSAGRRIRADCRLLHRIFRVQIRALLPRGISGHDVDQRHGHHALSSADGRRLFRFLRGCLRISGSLAKMFLLIAGFIWIRGTLPRLRMDQLMDFAWKFMLPDGTDEPGDRGQSGGSCRMGSCVGLVCGAMVIMSYVLLGRALVTTKSSRKAYLSFCGVSKSKQIACCSGCSGYEGNS